MPTRIDPLTIRFDLQDVVAKLLREYDLTQAALAQQVNVNSKDISEFFNQPHRTGDARERLTEAILVALKVDREEIDSLIARMNGQGPPRLHNGRAEDRDPHLNDAIQYGRRIAALPADAQDTLFVLVRVLERAYRDATRPR